MGWLQQKYQKRLGKVRFMGVMLDSGTWRVNADFYIKGDLLDKKRKRLVVSIDPETTSVVGYTDVTEAMRASSVKQ